MGIAPSLTNALTVSAPAKVNLTLHVTGQRAGGYHDIDSLVVFAGIGDRISARPADTLSLKVTGPFRAGVPEDGRNLVLQAAACLQEIRGATTGAALTLEKHLPHAAGLGGGSSDAAQTLNLLARFWDVAPLDPTDPILPALGADVPACYAAPVPLRMQGIGDRLWPVPDLPRFAMVLVNPRIEVPTGAVFEAMVQRSNPAMDEVPPGLDFAGFCAWLGRQRNDMHSAAQSLAPEIGHALTTLRRQSLIRFATMSGSGATCIGLAPDMDQARRAARAIQVGNMGWWVAPAHCLTPSDQFTRATT